VNVAVQRGDSGGAQVLVVDEQDVVVGVPTVLIAPGELQRDDVPGDAKPPLEPLPRGPSSNALPRGSRRVDQLRELVVQVVRDGDRHQGCCVPVGFPGDECIA